MREIIVYVGAAAENSLYEIAPGFGQSFAAAAATVAAMSSTINAIILS